MNCPRCHEPVEPGAAFCGNCGQPLQQAQVPQPPAPSATVAAAVPVPPVPGQAAATPMTIPADGVLTPASASGQVTTPTPAVSQPTPMQSPIGAPVGSGGFPQTPPPNGIPGYARANPDEHKAETKAMIALIVGVLSLGGLFITYIGIVLGVIAAVLAGGARPELRKKTVATLAMVFAVIGFLLGAIGLGYNIYRYSKDGEASTGSKNGNSSQSSLSDTTGNDATTKSTEGKSVDNPCFKATLAGMKTVDAPSSNCGVTAYDTTDELTAKRALIIDGVNNPSVTADKLSTAGKALADEYINKQMTVVSQKVGTFANSPAYYISLKKDTTTLSVAIVVHKTTHGENAFILVDTVAGDGADVSQYESSWQWK